MTDRRSRGASRSSNCFQTSSAFGFLFFIFRSRVGIRGVGSPGRAGIFDQKLKVKSGKKRKKQTPRYARDDSFARSARAGLSAVGDGLPCLPACRGQAATSRENAVQKEKGRNHGLAAVSPEIIIPELKHFASPNFKKFYA